MGTTLAGMDAFQRGGQSSNPSASYMSQCPYSPLSLPEGEGEEEAMPVGRRRRIFLLNDVAL